MSAWEPEEDEQFQAASDVPEEETPSADDDDGFDDLPTTSLSDEEYTRFAGQTFDAQGREKGDPPVAAILIGITLAIVVAAFLLLR